MKTNLFLGDICQAPADVICTSTNPHLDLMIGTGGAVRSAGGWGIQEECYRIIRERGGAPERTFLDPGEAVRTSAGTLPYAAVIHCVAIDSFHNSTAEIICDCVRNALTEFAKVPAAKSLAFPVFASGNGRFDFAASLSEICRVLKEHSPAQLEEAWIVVHEDYRRKTAETILRDAFGDVSVALP